MRWPTFLLIVSLAAGCGGAIDSSPAGSVAGASKLFVGDSGNGAIGSSANANPSAGTLALERTLSGSNTQLDTSLFDFALDAANDRLYVADLRSILVFSNASTATGNLAPARILTTIPGFFGAFNGGVYVDTTRNMLYAGTNFIGTTQDIRVFDNASTATSAAPSRVITFTTNSVVDIVVDISRDILYAFNVDSSGFTRICAFNNASTLNSTVSGVLSPSRTIVLNGSGITGPVGRFIDAAGDRLYVPGPGTVLVFDTASSAQGTLGTTLAASRTINLPVADFHALFVETTANRLYAADSSEVDVIANASTVNGVPPVMVRAAAPVGFAFRAIAVRP